jgi:hypothetical protein
MACPTVKNGWRRPKRWSIALHLVQRHAIVLNVKVKDKEP